MNKDDQFHDHDREAVSAHVEKYLGNVESVIHEMPNPHFPSLHIDVLVVEATEENPYHFLVTSGMSDQPMTTPEGYDVPQYIELMMALPKYWQLPKTFEVIGGNNTQEWEWPIEVLKFLAKIPAVYQTWFGIGHTIPNGDPALPYEETTKQCGAIILPSRCVPAEFLQLQVNKEKTIHFFSVVPLYNEEMELKLKEGLDGLLTLFNEQGISDIIDPERANVALV